MGSMTNRVEEYIDEEQDTSEDTSSPAQQKDVILLTRKLRKYIDSKHEHLVKDLIEQNKALKDQLSQQSKYMQELLSQFKQLQGEQKSLKDYWELHAATLRKDLFDRATTQFASQDEWLTKRLESTTSTGEMDSLSKSFTAGAESTVKMLEGLFKLLPVPQVTTVLPEGAIKLLQESPTIHVNPNLVVPDKSFKFDIPQPIINIPKIEVPAALVHVNVPKQKPPEVNVEVKNKPMVKTFDYYEDGRPKEIREKYLDDEE